MAIKLVSNEKTAETSSKGNQEKWYNNMIRYRMLFLGKKTFYAAAIAAIVLLPASVVLMAIYTQLTVLRAAIPLLCTVLCAGLIVVYRTENLIQLSGITGAVLLLELCRYLYLTEQVLQLGVDGIVSRGLYFCMLFSGYIMVAFMMLIVASNHFTIQLGKVSSRTKMEVNQASIVLLLLCFLAMTAERWLMGDLVSLQLTDAVSYLSDLCLFILIACCDMVLTVDGQAFSKK